MSRSEFDTFDADHEGPQDARLDAALRAALAPEPLEPAFAARLRQAVADGLAIRRARRLTLAPAAVAAAMLLTLALGRGPLPLARGPLSPLAPQAPEWSDPLDSSIAMIESQLDELHARVAAETLARVRAGLATDDWDKPADQPTDSESAPPPEGARRAPAPSDVAITRSSETMSDAVPRDARPRRLT